MALYMRHCSVTGNRRWIIGSRHYMKSSDISKSRKIISIVDYFQNKYGDNSLVIKDYWDDEDAIGFSNLLEDKLIYVGLNDDGFYITLESGDINSDGYITEEEHFDISLKQLEEFFESFFEIKAID